MRIGLAILIAGSATFSGLARAAEPALEAASAQPFIPSFWDPQASPAKPDLGTRTSIRFVTGTDYPPFNVALADGTVVGFNVDLARALCDELQVTCTIQARDWASLKPLVLDDKADAAIASLSIDERAPGLAFTSAYYKTPARFVVRASTANTTALAEGLAGKRVGVVAGTAHQAYLAAFFPHAAASAYPTIDAARAALKAGTLDAVFGDAIAAAGWLGGTDAAGCCAFVGGPYTESRFFGPGAGIAVRKGDVVLRQALDYALARLAATGIYADLYLRYFPIGFY